jgi:cyclopropane-fatty-acyl-phospholipid synthase
MTERATVATRLADAVSAVLGVPETPWRLRAWDGSEAGPTDAPVLVVRSPQAVRRLVWAPGELGLVRAYVAGEIDLEGDVFATLEALSSSGRLSSRATFPRPSARDWLELGRTAAALHAVGAPPAPPPGEFPRPRRIRRNRPDLDAAAITHHYDVGNDFYAMVLGPSMVYSCAYWDGPDATLEDAQRDKLDLICRKLGLKEGQRLLDVGCGWGSMVLHAAREYGVRAVGITLSEEQATFARKRIADAGLADRIEIRVQDYREIKDEPFDAISSIGMAEHVGRAQYAEYASALYDLLTPGGRLLNHQIARRPLADEETYRVDEFIDRYVFPDGELAPVGRTAGQLEEAGFEVRDVEAIREHYALTLRSWVANLEARWDEAVRLTSAGRARVWRLYMAASALSFERNRIGVNQVLAIRTPESGASGVPLRTRVWKG